MASLLMAVAGGSKGWAILLAKLSFSPLWPLTVLAMLVSSVVTIRWLRRDPPENWGSREPGSR